MIDESKKDYLANLYNQEEIIELIQDSVIDSLQNEISQTLQYVKGQVDIIIESNHYENEEIARQLEELI